MPAKEKPTNRNVNNNTNNITVNVTNPPHEEGNSDKKKAEPNWYVRTIVGGIIALALSLVGYYVKNNWGKGPAPVIENGAPAIQPIK